MTWNNKPYESFSKIIGFDFSEPYDEGTGGGPIEGMNLFEFIDNSPPQKTWNQYLTIVCKMTIEVYDGTNQWFSKQHNIHPQTESIVVNFNNQNCDVLAGDAVQAIQDWIDGQITINEAINIIGLWAGEC